MGARRGGSAAARAPDAADAARALEQGWLLLELRDRFGLTQAELARRFDRTVSWVSRRLALCSELPSGIQDHVRQGAIAAHAAMRYLAPLARAKREDCLRLAEAIAKARLSTRQIRELYAGWVSGSERSREALLSDPLLYLRVQAETRRPDPPVRSPTALLCDDLGLIAATARRATCRLGALAWEPEREEVARALQQAISDTRTLFLRLEKETGHAG